MNANARVGKIERAGWTLPEDECQSLRDAAGQCRARGSQEAWAWAGAESGSEGRELGERTWDVEPLVEGSNHARADALARELAIVVERLQEDLVLRSQHTRHRPQKARVSGTLVACPDCGRMRHAGNRGRRRRGIGVHAQARPMVRSDCDRSRTGHRAAPRRTFRRPALRRHVVGLRVVALRRPRGRSTRLLRAGLQFRLGLAHCQAGGAQDTSAPLTRHPGAYGLPASPQILPAVGRLPETCQASARSRRMQTDRSAGRAGPRARLRAETPCPMCRDLHCSAAALMLLFA